MSLIYCSRIDHCFCFSGWCEPVDDILNEWVARGDHINALHHKCTYCDCVRDPNKIQLALANKRYDFNYKILKINDKFSNKHYIAQLEVRHACYLSLFSNNSIDILTFK